MSNSDQKVLEKHVTKPAAKKRNVFGSCANIFVKLYNSASRVLFPSNIKCVVCGVDLPEKQDIEICQKCLRKLRFISKNERCQRCGGLITGQGKFCFDCMNVSRDFDVAYSVFTYEGDVVKMLAMLKYNNKPYISRTLTQFLAALYKEVGLSADLIIPIPLHKRREEWRGYNQAVLLADGLCDLIKVPLNTTALIKTRETEPQAMLSLEERKNNLKNCFKVADKYAVKGKTILLIDDVFTTGTTCSACAQVLKKAHAKNVIVLTIAHSKFEPKSVQLTEKEVNKVINVQ